MKDNAERRDLQDAAERLARLGYPVLPTWGVVDGRCTCPAGAKCDRPGKHPPMTHYKARATTDPAEAASYFAMVPRVRYNLAVLVPTWLVVVDCDDQQGLEYLRRWKPWPVAPTVYTGRGTHQYFRWPLAGDSPSVGKLDGYSIDIRGTGDMAHLPPSTHASGKRYEWAAGLAPWECPLPLLPDAFAEHLARVAAHRTRPRMRVEDVTTLEGATALARRRAAYARGTSNGAGKGAYGLRRTLAEAGAPPHVIAAALEVFRAEAA